MGHITAGKSNDAGQLLISIINSDQYLKIFNCVDSFLFRCRKIKFCINRTDFILLAKMLPSGIPRTGASGGFPSAAPPPAAVKPNQGSGT